MLRQNHRRTARLLSVLIFIMLSAFSRQVFCASDPLDNWSPRSTQGPSSQANNLKNITYANGLYVAVGDNSTVVTSKDQVTWNTLTLVSDSGTTDLKLYAVTYGNGLWVAVGSYIWTSPDAVTWTFRGNPTSGPFYAVAYGNGIYVAAGGLGGLITAKPGPAIVATSPDGITWTDRSTTSGITAEPTKALIYASGLFVQLGWHQPPYYSTDGLTFKAASVPGDTNTSGIPGYNHAVGMAYGNGIFLIVGCCLDVNYAGSIMTSKDGKTWTKTTGPYFTELSENSTDLSLASNLAFGNGVFLGLEEDSAGGAACGSGSPTDTYTSPDGINWTAHQLNNGGGNAIAASPAGFTLVGNAGAIYASTNNGATWSLVSSPTVVWTAAAYGNGTFAAVGSGGNILTSQDGTSWSPVSNVSLAATYFSSVVHGSAFVAAGTEQNTGWPSIATSANGTSWTLQTAQSSAPNRALAFGKGTYVGVLGSTIYSSTDGASWTVRASDPAGAGFNSATFGNGTFVVVGNQTIMTSPDGINWTSRVTGLSYSLRGVAAGAGLFAAVGDNAAIMVSADGNSWSQSASGVSGGLTGITFGSGRFVAIGGQKSITYSLDGKTWTPKSLPVTGSPWAIAYGNSTFIALTTNEILQSDPVATPSSDPAAASTGGGGGGGGCFIATAAYGSDFAWQVRAFKYFRDTYLLTGPIGRAAVGIYYAASPPVAALIADRPVLKSITRFFLTPAAYAVVYPWQSAAASVICIFLIVVVVRRRR